jgi:hypothetical protein
MPAASAKNDVTPNNFFAEDSSKRVRSAHGRVSPSGSRLLSLRTLLSTVPEFKESVTSFLLTEETGMVREKYVMDLTEYRVEVIATSRNHMNRADRCIRQLATAISINNLLHAMQREWETHQSAAIEDEYLMVNDIIMRAFVLCSYGLRYETEVDTGYWSVYFEDLKGNTDAEIIISRK